MLDKVRCVAIGGIVSIPILVYYEWYTIKERLQDTGAIWLIVALICALFWGTIIGLFLNPILAYKRNDDICVSGLPFPIQYGMPVDDGCISGHFVFRNLILDIIYLCLLFMAIVLFLLTIGFKYGILAFILLVIFIPSAIFYLLDIALNFYPIQTEYNGNNKGEIIVQDASTDTAPFGFVLLLIGLALIWIILSEEMPTFQNFRIWYGLFVLMLLAIYRKEDIKKFL